MNAITQNKIPTPFSSAVWQTASLFVIVVISFTAYVWSEKQIDRANNTRYQSFLLADELRQSSDDLTRMARSYVVTADPLYKKNYQAILDIRDGKKPRPEGYQNIYWDLLPNEQTSHYGSGQAIALLELMRQAGFSEDELRKLAQAKANSDELTATELTAMQLVETSGPEAEASRAMARMMMHDDKYNQAKAAIMKPIDEFYELMEKRTLDAVQAAIDKALTLRAIFIAFLLGLMLQIWRINSKALLLILGCSIDEIYKHISSIGFGDSLSAIPITDDKENNVLGWLIKTKANLNKIDHERKRMEEVLRQSETTFRTLAEALPQIVWITEPDGRNIYYNQQWVDFTGLTLEESYGQGWKTPIHPDDQPRVWDAWQQAIQTDGNYSLECRLRRADGIYRWWLIRAVSLHDASGKIINWFGTCTDIQDIKESEEKLQLAASVFTHAREGIMITAADGAIIEVNKAFSDISGYSRDEVLGRNPRFLNSGRHEKEFYTVMWRDLIEQGCWSGEIWNRRKNGEVYAEMLTISAVRDAQGKTRQYVALFTDITALKEHEKQLEHIAHYDALTSLPNRVLLADRLQQAMVQAQRRGQRLAVVFLDLDGFKAINDNHGHETGDQLLIAVAARMKQALREGDTLARLGGDEFVAVLLDVADIEASAPILTRLLAAASQPVYVDDLVLQVSASLGVTFYPQAEDIDADQLLRQADQTMYQAKLTGKNRYHFFDAEHDRSLRNHHESLDRIRRALNEREFVLYYQPKVNMRKGKSSARRH